MSGTLHPPAGTHDEHHDDRRHYDDVVAALDGTGMVARGGFAPVADDGVPQLADGRSVRTVVVIGNVGGAIWPRFRREQPQGANPLDTWTRSLLAPIARRFDADFVHPSDEPFRPFLVELGPQPSRSAGREPLHHAVVVDSTNP